MSLQHYLKRSFVKTGLPRPRHGVRAAAGALAGVTPPVAGFPFFVAPPAAAAPVFSPDVPFVDVQSVRQAAWVRAWASPEVLRASLGRVGKRRVS